MRAIGLTLLALPFAAASVALLIVDGWLMAATVPAAFALTAALYLGVKLALEP